MISNTVCNQKVRKTREGSKFPYHAKKQLREGKQIRRDTNRYKSDVSILGGIWLLEYLFHSYLIGS